MTRKTLTGLLLAATTLTAGTLGVTYAQDDAAAQQQQADLEAAIAAALGKQAEEKHDHDHEPTTVHSGEKAFKLDDETAYPDPDGFESMFDRISYAMGRGDATRIPKAGDALDTKTLREGLTNGLSEDNKDYALGYAQGFELARQFLAQRTEEVDMDAFVDGITAALKEDKGDKGIGYLIGNSFREAEIDLKVESYITGIDESIAASKPAVGEGDAPEPAKTKLTEEQVQETLGAFNAYMMAKQKQDAIDEGQAYIDALKAEDGWKKTESGIAYKVIEAGKGKSPDQNDVATMDYELKLTDGGVLQTTFDTPQTVPFSAEQVIKGWGEILQLMSPAATFETVIPYNLGYGEQGSPPDIPPYATLVFKMKMHSFEAIENKPEPKPAPPAKPAE